MYILSDAGMDVVGMRGVGKEFINLFQISLQFLERMRVSVFRVECIFAPTLARLWYIHGVELMRWEIEGKGGVGNIIFIFFSILAAFVLERMCVSVFLRYVCMRVYLRPRSHA